MSDRKGKPLEDGESPLVTSSQTPLGQAQSSLNYYVWGSLLLVFLILLFPFFPLSLSEQQVVSSVYYAALTNKHQHIHRPHPTDLKERARLILTDTPLVDGHNDLLILIRDQNRNIIEHTNFTTPFENGSYIMSVDLPRIRKGLYSGAFWSAFYPCPIEYSTSFETRSYDSIVRATFTQIDLFHRLSQRYPHFFTLAQNAEEALSAWRKNGRMISPLAIEGLHQIGNRLATLRQYHAMGVRYATLTWNCHNQYADAAVLTFEKNQTSVAAPEHWGGISTEKGRELIWEMNRLGMIVDLAHVSWKTMRDALVGDPNADSHTEGRLDESISSRDTGLDARAPDIKKRKWKGSIAPPIVSHSSAYALCPHPRNVPDSILPLIRQRNSIVMVNFSPEFISCTPPSSNSSSGLPDFYSKNSTIHQVARHIVHIGEQIGFEHVGIGSDFDGIQSTPAGLEDVSKMPDLVEELLRMGVSDEDARKVVGENLIRVWKEVDAVSADLQASGWVPAEDDDLGSVLDDL